jgi:hypothetical protein
MINATVINQKEYILKDSKMPILGNKSQKLDGDKIPNSGNGKRASMSFWIYIHDLNKGSGAYRHILHRGDESDGYEKAAPFVRMDKDTNSISITWAPDSSSTDTADLDNLRYGIPAIGNSPATTFVSRFTTAQKTDTVNGYDDKKWQFFKQAHGITFDYIPLQRWVHICAVVDENAMGGGSITGYIDGELVKSVSNAGKTSFTKINTPLGDVTPSLDMRNANLDKKGNIYTGGGDMGEFGFSGLLCNIAFYNYDMSANDVYKVYKKGPIDNLLAKLGLPAYGVQSPVYRIG